jgi:hypothetical protein
MENFNIKAFEAKLATNKPDIRMEAVEEGIVVIRKVITSLIETLIKSDEKLFIAERIYMVDSYLENSLVKLYKEVSDEDFLFHLAVLLLLKKNYIGVPKLLKQIEMNDLGRSLFAALKLANAGVNESVKPIIEKLKSININEIDYIVGYLEALNILNAKLPAEVFNKLDNSNNTIQIKASLDKLR